VRVIRVPGRDALLEIIRSDAELSEKQFFLRAFILRRPALIDQGFGE